MTLDARAAGYVDQVLSRVPPGVDRDRIEADLRGHIAERLEEGASIDAVLAGLGDPAELAASYLTAVPLVNAPLGRRLMAKIVDFLLMGLITGGLAILGWAAHGPFLMAGLMVLSMFACCAWFMVAEHRTGQTPGKRLFGMRAVTEQGEMVSLGQAFVRQLPLFLEVFWLDALCVFFTDKRQRAAELLSHTRVVATEASEATGNEHAVSAPA